MSLPLASWPAEISDYVNLYAGDTAHVSLTFKNPDGTVIDMTNMGTWKAQARPDTTSSKYVDMVVDITSTQINLSISADNTSKMQQINLIWGFDLQLTKFTDGEKVTVAVGKILLRGDYTK